jgi:hypothetical protein
MIEKTVGNQRRSREEGETDGIQEESGYKIDLHRGVNTKKKRLVSGKGVGKRTASSEIVRHQ